MFSDGRVAPPEVLTYGGQHHRGASPKSIHVQFYFEHIVILAGEVANSGNVQGPVLGTGEIIAVNYKSKKRVVVAKVTIFAFFKKISKKQPLEIPRVHRRLLLGITCS